MAGDGKRNTDKWKERSAAELGRREKRRSMIAGARASAQSVTVNGATYKLVKLPPEVGPQKLQARDGSSASQQPERIIGLM